MRLPALAAIPLLLLALRVPGQSAPASAAGAKPASPPGFQPGTGPGMLPEGQIGADFVSIPSGDEQIRAYVAWPGGSGPFPVLIVIQEWWGVNDWVKSQARREAGRGYVAVAVDLYRGQVAKDADTAHQLMRALNEDRGVRYLKDAFAWIHAQPWARGERIGAIGWCMGGGYAAGLAAAEPRLKAAVVNYGWLPDDPAKIKAIKARMLGNFGGQDQGIRLADVRKFKGALEKRGGSLELHEWPNSGHAFMNETSPNHNVSDALNAWFYIDNFLAKELGGAPGR